MRLLTGEKHTYITRTRGAVSYIPLTDRKMLGSLVSGPSDYANTARG